MQRDTSLKAKLSDAAGWIIAGCALLAVIVITAMLTTIDNALGAGLMFAGLLVGGFLSIAAHEVGHAACARLVGWRVRIISVLGVVYRPGQGVRLSTKYSHDAGGYVLGSPPSAALDSRWRSIIFTAGGPVVSLLTGPLFLLWLITLPNDLWKSSLGAGLFIGLMSFGIAGASGALMTLWPLRGRDERPNDMGMILDALSKRDPAEDVRGVGWAWALFDHGVEPKAWAPWMHASVARSAHNPWASPVAPLLAFVTALENGDVGAARTAAQRHAHDIGKLMRAFIAAYFDNNAPAAESELAGSVIGRREDTLLLLCLFIDMRIKALKGDTDGASRTRALILRDIQTGAPKPFWEQLFKRYGA